MMYKNIIIIKIKGPNLGCLNSSLGNGNCLQRCSRDAVNAECMVWVRGGDGGGGWGWWEDMALK